MIAFDIDGVLADTAHRMRHIRVVPKDWPAFFAGIPDDPPLEPGRVALLRAMDEDEVILISGRPEHTREATLTWLAAHGFPQLRVDLRRAGDRRPAPLVKRQMLDRLGGPARIRRVVDDDPAVGEALRAAGYEVEIVAYGSGSIGA